MKPNFRITFYDGPEGHKSKSVDVYAKDCADARSQAWKMDEAKSREYTDMMIEKIPDKVSVIGIMYEYTDPYVPGKSTQPMFIKANSEEEAIRYYNNHCLGKHFDFPNYRKDNEEGRCTRGRIVNTYYVNGAVLYDFDATLEYSKGDKVVDTLLADATERSEKTDTGVTGKEDIVKE